MAEETYVPDGPIHSWFSLSYANYLVCPRSVLQSMSIEWQERFVACLRELHDEFGHLNWPPYNVQALARETEPITPMDPCEECEGSGWVDISPNHLGECFYCDGEGEVKGEERYETPEEVGVISDPIPHYWRGRTRLAPASDPNRREIR